MLWISLIFVLSSIPNLHLGLMVSNIAHVLVYGILAALIWWGTMQLYRSKWTLIAACIIPCFALAILDELNQKHVPGRTSDPMDILMDSIGVCLSISILLAFPIIKEMRPAKALPGRDDLK